MSPPLPGDPTRHTVLCRIIRADHAGQYGAGRVRKGLGAVRGQASGGHQGATTTSYEQAFAGLIVDRQVRPTAMLAVWHLGGFALGALSAALGQQGVTACARAVTEAIDEHYAQQAARLDDDESGLRTIVEQCRAEELARGDASPRDEAELSPGYALMGRTIKLGCKAALAVSALI